MAITLVQSKRVLQSSAVTSWSLMFDSPTTSGNMLIAVAYAADSGFDVVDGMSVSDGGTNTFSSAIQVNGAGADSYQRLGALFVANCTGKSSHQLTVTPTATGAGFSGIGDLTIMELSSVKLVSPLDGSPISATGTVSPGSTAGMAATATGLHIAAMGFSTFTALTITEDSTWTQVFDPAADNFGTHTIIKVAANAVSQTPSWVMNNTPDQHWEALQFIVSEQPSTSTAEEGVTKTGIYQAITYGFAA
jgi:hypothetical protein